MRTALITALAAGSLAAVGANIAEKSCYPDSFPTVPTAARPP